MPLKDLKKRKEYMQKYNKKYSKSSKGKEAHMKARKKYNISSHGQEVIKKYYASPTYKSKHRLADMKYEQSSKGAANVRHRQQQYRDSPKGKNYYRNWRKSEQGRDYNLNRLYRIGASTYNKMLEKQSGVCAICSKTPPHNKKLGIDHDHTTGKVRGLLCSNCNFILGHCKDSIEVLQTAIKYLQRERHDK